METTVKPGWKTSEFWGKVALQVTTLWGAVAGFVPPKWAAVVTVSLEGAYTIGRVAIKIAHLIQEARIKAPAATVSATAIATDAAAK